MNWADQEYAIGRGIAAIRHRHEPALQPFVRGVIELELPELLAQATGSTFPNVSAYQLAEISYPCLDKYEQRAIAHILGTLDDKIELNRRMNQTLEAMARALFTSWFVDFDPVRAKMEGAIQGCPRTSPTSSRPAGGVRTGRDTEGVESRDARRCCVAEPRVLEHQKCTRRNYLRRSIEHQVGLH